MVLTKGHRKWHAQINHQEVTARMIIYYLMQNTFEYQNLETKHLHK